MTDEATGTIDGRRARGERRRDAIVAATLAVIEHDGVAGVTHRTVATRAGIPPSSVTYHFATLDELLVAALTSAVDEYTRQLHAIAEQSGDLDTPDGLDGLARLIVDAGGPGRRRALAERELTLLAARRPALRPAARRWREVVADIARQQSSDPLAGDALIGISDAICARVLLGDETPTVEGVRRQLAHALRVD